MRILYYNPTTTQKRFVPFEAIRGSAFFRRPNYDAMRLAALCKKHDFLYYDERIEEKPNLDPDIVVVNVPLNLSRYVESTVRQKWSKKTKIICHGFYSTLFPKQNGRFADSVVIGDIANIWSTIITDMKKDKLSKLYVSNRKDQFNVDRSIEMKYGFTPMLSQLRTSFGCTCFKTEKDYCFENIVYKKFVQWDINKSIEEVRRIQRKIIFLRDDDFLHDLDYAKKLLEKCWRYKKMWILQTKGTIYEHAHVLPFLRDHGVRIMYLKEDWMGDDLTNKITSENFVKEKKYEVDLIHSCRIAFGCRLRLGHKGEDFNFYRRLLKFLMKIKVDLIKISVQTPIPKTDLSMRFQKDGILVNDLTLYDQWMPVVQVPGITPQALYSWMEWLRDRFYSWDSILFRNVLVSPRLGFYNTVLYPP